MKNIIIIAISILIFSSCNKHNDSTWMYYDEYVCDAGWIENGDRKSKLNLEGFLKGNEIIPLKIKVDGENNPECNQCDCLTGRTFRVKVYESQTYLMHQLGFYR